MKKIKIRSKQPLWRSTGKDTLVVRLGRFIKTNTVARRTLIAISFLALWLLTSYLFFRRFPNNYTEPNFFGEEGSVWARNIINHGFWSAFFTTFNGYYIWGLYVLEKIAFSVNWLFYGGQFANLPRSISLVSYGFLGLMAILPIVLLRRYIRLAVLVLVIPLIVYVPLRGWDYGIIGDIGNYKFAYVYVAFLLLIYRHYLPKRSRKFYIVDVILLLCAYTNVTVYLLLPFGLLRYLPDVRGGNVLNKLRKLVVHDHSIQSLLVLGILLLPQLYVVKHDGIPAMPGYLDQPYNSHRTTEIFIARSYLYQFVFPFYKYLNDTMVGVLAFILAAIGVRLAGTYRKLINFGILTIFVTTFLFVIKRPGISTFYNNYTDSGPDQFFFTQNWIFGFIFLIVFVEIISKLKSSLWRSGIYLSSMLCFLVFLAPQSGTFGKNDFESKTVGNIYSVGQKACATNAQSFNITIYPTPELTYKGVSRKLLCTPAVLTYRHP